MRLLSGLSDAQKQRLAVAAAVVACCLALATIVWQLTGYDAAAASRTRTVIDSETREVFLEFGIPEDGRAPYMHPETGERTLYPAEKCYWAKEGGAKLDPTYVLLNELIGSKEPTKCPDCGRRVVRHNPMPPTELLVAASEKSE